MRIWSKENRKQARALRKAGHGKGRDETREEKQARQRRNNCLADCLDSEYEKIIGPNL